MPASTAAAVRKQIAQRRPDPIYLIVGDDDAEMSRLAADLGSLVEDALRAFNSERLYASDQGVTAAAVVEVARILPMMGTHRVVTVLRAERLLKPKRKGRAGEDTPEGGDEPGPSLEALEEYARAPQPSTVLVLVAADVDRTRRLYKQLQKTASIVECWGLRSGMIRGREDLREAARQAEQMIRHAADSAGQQIEPAAVRLVAERAGADIGTLRGDVERLMLYAEGKSTISIADARETVSAASSQDDWAVTNAIERGNVAEALRQLGLALEGGAVSFQILGQLAYFVRQKLALSNPQRIPAAVEALFRTDLNLKSSGGDPRVLLERLVVDLCGAGRARRAPG